MLRVKSLLLSNTNYKRAILYNQFRCHTAVSSTSSVIDGSVDSSNSTIDYSYHIPVMRDECCDNLNIVEGGIYVDCTLGGGGHTRAILERGGRVIGLDQDTDAIARTSFALKQYIESGRLEIIQTNFRYINDAIKSSRLLSTSTTNTVDGVLMDLGISSHQIDEPTRGFSYGMSGPLDMRMAATVTSPSISLTDSLSTPTSSTNSNSLTASKIINEWDGTAIANILYEYGDENKSRQIAREIVAARPLQSTGDLEKVISRITSWKDRPKVLSRCFQALRIAVNDEIGALEDALSVLHTCIRPGGRLVVLSYHSLEDRRIKNLFYPKPSDADVMMKGVGMAIQDINPWVSLFKRAKVPSNEEIERNRRSRSAKLRVAERAGAISTGDISVSDSDTDTNVIVGKNGKRLGAKQLAKLSARK